MVKKLSIRVGNIFLKQFVRLIGHTTFKLYALTSQQANNYVCGSNYSVVFNTYDVTKQYQRDEFLEICIIFSQLCEQPHTPIIINM